MADDERAFEIPASWLPAGFADRLGSPPPRPVKARPAATVVLLRDAAAALEVLLLRRDRGAAFVPGAYVFPGGRVDPDDADQSLLARVQGVDAEPAAEYWVAAAREAFEEAGVLLARRADGEWAAAAATDPRVAGWRERLLAHQAGLGDALADLEASLDLRDVVYCAHWITPEAEPRRYDTHFFAAELPARREVGFDRREMTDAVWLTPSLALERFRAGRLPMVFPTVRTLESLARFHSVAEALDRLRDEPVRPVLPRLVRTAGGVGIISDD